MAQRKTLNEVQVGVLRWISDGCPDNGVDDISARISAGALRNRGLVRTSGRGPTWKATITAAGKEYLQQVDGPKQPLPRQPNVSVTQQLVDEVAAAGGSLRVPRKHWNVRDGVDYEPLSAACRELRDGPLGKPSGHGGARVSAEELLIELVADEAAAKLRGDGEPLLALTPVPVPARVTKYHRVAREFRDRTNLHEMSRKALPRALRIMHALAVEAERRGYGIACVRVREDSWAAARSGSRHKTGSSCSPLTGTN